MFTKKDLLKLLAPLIVEQILAVLVGMVDVVMVAAVGEAAVSGVSLVDSISILIIQILAALATGGAVISAQYLGKKQSENACRAAGQLIGVTTVLSVAVTFAALVGNRYLLSTIFGKVEPAVMDDALIYFRITALSYPFIAVYNSCAALFRSMGNSKVSMAVSLVMNSINIVGNAICVFGLHMGVSGVAYPTLLSRLVAAIMMLYLIQNPGNTVRINRLEELRPNLKMIKNILSIGIPNGLESGMFQFGKIALQSLVSSLGTAAIASYAVASNLVTLLYLPGNAIGLGLITIVGQCVGAGEKKQAKRYTRLLVGVNYGILLLLCTVMVVFSDRLVSVYNLSGEAAGISARMIVAHSYAMIVWPFAFTVPYALRASMDAKFTMAVSVFSMWLFRIAFAYFFVHIMDAGVMGVWYGMFIDWIFRAIVFVWRFHGIEKRAVSVS
ncbi:MATE family efflux transporter [Clostridium sp. Marseille-P2415]|uniref:MATE family efflux transporter n=1 Tax=Clostridium sp. Marseille-P2415 TaxID=1805471 RepID=UPI000988703E|nr:MATE family efflux transporter [Clostridium sp. Marseille-P2415]